MKVVRTENAVAQLHAIHGWIAQNSLRFAVAMIDRLTARSHQIGRNSESGSIVAEYERPDVREVIEGPYRVIYRLTGNHVDVLSVIHGARPLPDNIAEL